VAVKIIAEVGECFNGDINTAFKMIKEAKNAGCDIVKFQLLDMDEVADNDPEYEWFSKLNLPPDNIDELVKCAKNENIEILFTPVSVKTASYIVNVGLKTVKIASSFINKHELLEYINVHFETVYVSTGMASLEEIAQVVELLERPREVIVLHCVSEYPTGPLLEERGLVALDEKNVHMNMMCILKSLYPMLKVGYSDHTDDILAPIVAVAMGADVIEKHITLDRDTPIEHFNNHKEYMGTDHVLSIEPPKLKQMVDAIRRVELIKGEWKWERSDGEKILKRFLRGRYTER
jgi:sialic acid synthase SpsE